MTCNYVVSFKLLCLLYRTVGAIDILLLKEKAIPAFRNKSSDFRIFRVKLSPSQCPQPPAAHGPASACVPPAAPASPRCPRRGPFCASLSSFFLSIGNGRAAPRPRSGMPFLSVRVVFLCDSDILVSAATCIQRSHAFIFPVQISALRVGPMTPALYWTPALGDPDGAPAGVPGQT